MWFTVVVSGATALLNAASCAVSECCIHVIHCCCQWCCSPIECCILCSIWMLYPCDSLLLLVVLQPYWMLHLVLYLNVVSMWFTVVVSGAAALLNAASCAVSECCIHVIHCCCQWCYSPIECCILCCIWMLYSCDSLLLSVVLQPYWMPHLVLYLNVVSMWFTVVVSGATALLNAASCAVSECCIHVIHCCCQWCYSPIECRILCCIWMLYPCDSLLLSVVLQPYWMPHLVLYLNVVFMWFTVVVSGATALLNAASCAVSECCIHVIHCCCHRLIQGPVHPSFGLVKCTAGRVYPSNSASWTGNNPSKVHWIRSRIN